MGSVWRLFAVEFAGRLDPLLELVAGGGRDGWAAADPAQLVVDPAVWLTGAMVSHRYQGVELAPQFAQLTEFRRGRRLARGRAPLQLLVLAAAQEVTHLGGVQQPGDA